MRQIFTIGHHDLKLLLKDRSAYIWLFFMPLLFVFIFGAASGNTSKTPSNPKPALAIDNRDQGFMSGILLEKLDAKGMRLVEPEEADKAARGIVIPAEFTENLIQGKATELTFFQVEGSSEESALMIEVRLTRALIALTSDLIAFSSAVPAGELTEPALRAAMAPVPLVTMTATYAGKEPLPSGFKQSFPGNLIMFLLLNLLIQGGASLADERKGGVIRRLAVYPISRFELVIGKIYGRFLLGMTQALIMVLAGVFGFKVSLGANPLNMLVLLMVYGWCCAGLGVLIGALVTMPEKVGGLSLILALLMAAMGGCWWPMEMVPDFMRTFGHMFPTAWAMDAMHQLISFGGGWLDIQFEVGVLALFGLGATLAAGRFLRFV